LTNYIRTKALSLSEHDSVAEVLFCGSSRSNFGDLEITTNIFLEGAGEVIYFLFIYCLFACLSVYWLFLRFFLIPSYRLATTGFNEAQNCISTTEMFFFFNVLHGLDVSFIAIVQYAKKHPMR